MRTFEQYIVESSQNYIFGGTDDRNTNVSIDYDIYPAFIKIIDDAIAKNKFYDDTPGFFEISKVI